MIRKDIIIDFLIVNNYVRLLVLIIFIIRNRKTKTFIYQYNFNIIMTPENKDQDEIILQTFCFNIECNNFGKKEIIKTISEFLNKKTNWSYSNLRFKKLID